MEQAFVDAELPHGELIVLPDEDAVVLAASGSDLALGLDPHKERARGELIGEILRHPGVEAPVGQRFKGELREERERAVFRLGERGIRQNPERRRQPEEQRQKARRRRKVADFLDHRQYSENKVLRV